MPSAPGSLIVREAGLVRPEGDDTGSRLWSLWDQIRVLLATYGQPDDLPVVVEFPAARAIPASAGSFQRSVLTLPTYGCAVGVAYIASATHTNNLAVMTPAADEWPWKGVPSTKNDPHKEGRVRYAASLFGLSPTSMGAKSVAGNVADAMLMGSWAMCDGGFPNCLAIDPSIRCTGWAYLERRDDGAQAG